MPPKSIDPFSILMNVYSSGRSQYLTGMIKHAAVCEHMHGNAYIHIGKTGEKEVQKEPYYLIAYLNEDDGKMAPWGLYSYKDNAEKTPNEISASWTTPVAIDDLIAWAISGAPAG
jgi:hypothetical protein